MPESSNIVLNYSRNYYEQKISALENYSRQLEQHLNTLDTLKGKIKDFWKDDDAITYMKTLNAQIGSVRTAQDMVNTLRATYAGLQQEIKKTKAKVTIDITDISGMLKLIADSGDEL